VEQRKKGLHLIIAKRWAHNLPLTLMSLAYMIVYMSCNPKSYKSVQTLGSNYSISGNYLIQVGLHYRLGVMISSGV
jgi:hypothetical protein